MFSSEEVNPMLKSDALRYRKIIQTAATSLTDEQALDAIMLFPRWTVGERYEVGDRVYYNKVLYKVLQAHDAIDGWNPEDAPSLFAKVLIPDPGEIPEWEQPSAENPYMMGDKVRFNGKIYESRIDYNVWSPEDYPDAWREIES
jgi:hypothetical protein